MDTSLTYKRLRIVVIFLATCSMFVACSPEAEEAIYAELTEIAATQTLAAEISQSETAAAQSEAAPPEAISTQVSELEAQVSGFISISETMTERCSQDVIISQNYTDELPLSQLNGLVLNGIYMKRTPGELYTEWSPKVPINGHTWIRWWCHSTTGNWADPGTWRLTNVEVKINVDCGDLVLDECRFKPGGDINLETHDAEGGTAERSRCDSEKTRAISARLGPQRKLEIRCLEQ